MMASRQSASSVLALGCLVLSLGLNPVIADLTQRQHILIVGSSTAYPIVAAAAERFGRQNGVTTPVVESTGSGGGIKLFCAGNGLSTPDIAMSSRSMKDSERATCASNNVYDIREIKIGYDGIVIANSKDAPRFSLSKKDLYLALAHDLPSPADPDKLVPNRHRTWDEINASLPQIPIRVLGPPPTSGTRDIFVERLLKSACLEMLPAETARSWNSTQFNQRCQALREDGAFVNAGENDARMVRKLINDSEALGIFGYSFLDRNRDRLQAASIDGIEPRFELIESGIYPLSRPLYLYVKPRHSAVLTDLDAFIDALVSARASGPDGYLIDHGLIPLPAPNGKTRKPNAGDQGAQADD